MPLYRTFLRTYILYIIFPCTVSSQSRLKSFRDRDEGGREEDEDQCCRISFDSVRGIGITIIICFDKFIE